MVIKPVAGPYTWYDPAGYLPDPLVDVLVSVLGESYDRSGELAPTVEVAYRRDDGGWRLSACDAIPVYPRRWAPIPSPDAPILAPRKPIDCRTCAMWLASEQKCGYLTDCVNGKHPILSAACSAFTPLGDASSAVLGLVRKE